MSLDEQYLPRYLTGEAFTAPTPHNDNCGVAGDWITVAEAIQLVKSWQRQSCRELVADPRLWACTKHRLTRNISYAIEKCARWVHYGER
jgi:hypothetical protein